MIAVLLAAVGGCAAVLTGAVRRYAIARDLMDVPNARSSHTVTTPRGGGIAIVAAVLTGIAGLFVMREIPLRLAAAFIGAGLLVALIGFIDDHRSLGVIPRLTGHAAAALWAFAWLGGGPLVGAVGILVVALALAWLINLTNFMDGIDGLAAIEAITVCVGGAAAAIAAGQPQWVAVPPLVVAAGAAGFLLWNWPPARIFMGDSGSGFLGVSMGMCALSAAAASDRLLWAWLVLPAAFVTDATVTLLRRVARGDAPHVAHRSHAYQREARRIGAHRPVTLAFAAINVVWLWPLALATAASWLSGTAAIALAYVPLVVAASVAGAGTPDRIAVANSESRRVT